MFMFKGNYATFLLVKDKRPVSFKPFSELHLWVLLDSFLISSVSWVSVDGAASAVLTSAMPAQVYLHRSWSSWRFPGCEQEVVPDGWHKPRAVFPSSVECAQSASRGCGLSAVSVKIGRSGGGAEVKEYEEIRLSLTLWMKPQVKMVILKICSIKTGSRFLYFRTKTCL